MVNHVTIKHSVTIGSKTDLKGNNLGSPVIEDHVTIEPHSIIIGPINIGKNAIIGAGSVVVKDIEPYSMGTPETLQCSCHKKNNLAEIIYFSK